MMTAPGKNIYIVSIKDVQGRMHSYHILATTKALALTKACELAGVPDGTEEQSSQNAGTIDAEAE